MQPGTPAQRTEQVAKELEEKALKISKEMEKRYKQKIVLYAVRWIGKHDVQSPFFSPPAGEEVAEVQLELLPGEKRKASSYEVMKLWRQLSGRIQGATQVSFESLGVPPLGRPFEMNLLAQDARELEEGTLSLKERLRQYPGIEEAEDDLTPSKRELRLELTPLARSLGITLQQLAAQIRFRFYGQEVMRLQRGRDEVKLFVRYPDNQREHTDALAKVWITTAQGQKLPLPQLATWTSTRSLKVIRRISRQRMSTVYAEIDDSKGNRQAILDDLFQQEIPALQKRLPALQVAFEGQRRQQEEVVGSMVVTLPLALFGIFLILVFVFESYFQAMIVLLTIPFGVIGAIGGHILLGMPLTILSFFGIVGVSGIVINDSLVLMDAINRNLRAGMTLFEATWFAGQSRLRPILSTTLTTVAGLLPLLAEKSRQAQFLIPMAISLAFGVLFATFVTLIFVPCFFVLINDIRRFLYWLRHGIWPLPRQIEPASPSRPPHEI
jgi:multidrug efflux pump subunit AcrB